jgi:type I restriction enzyme S subunit
MINGLKPYVACKDSHVQWLGRVPQHWEVQKLKYLTRFHNGLAFKPSEWSDSGVPIIRIQNLNGSHSFNYTDHKELPDFLRIRRGDLLFSWSGNRGTSFGPYIWNQDFEGYLNQHIFKLDGYAVERRYFYYLLRAVTSHIEEQTHGIIGLVHITKPELGSVRVPVAPTGEQNQIAEFLDYADRRILNYIRAKHNLIRLLKEEQQAIICSAVTQGVDPNVRLKPTGMTSLGKIPEHWEIKRAKYFFEESDERSTSGTEELMSVSHKTGVTARSEKNITMFMAESYVGHKLCRPGDVVVNTMWAWMAAVGVAKRGGVVSPSYGVYRPRRVTDFRSGYLDLLLRTETYRTEYVRGSRGITTSRLRLYPDDFLRILFVRPPLNEQDDILVWVQRETAELQTAIDVANREIALLREYRSRLILDVVTGKLDVREAAARLPLEVTTAERLDEFEDLPEDDETAENAELEAEETV